MSGTRFVDEVTGSSIENVQSFDGLVPSGNSLYTTGSKVLQSPSHANFILPETFTISFNFKMYAKGSRATLLSLGHYTNGVLIRNDGLDDLYFNGIGSSPGKLADIEKKTHVAICRNGTTANIWKDGSLFRTVNCPSGKYNTTGTGPLFGRSAHSSGEYSESSIDEFIITNNVLWSAPFTPPTSRYVLA